MSAAIKRWDVVSIDYPFIEGTESKRRPALVVSTSELAESHGLIWIAMITTAKAGLRNDDILISDHQAAGLPEDCVIRVAKLTTMTAAQVARRIGTISMKERTAVSALLKRYCP